MTRRKTLMLLGGLLPLLASGAADAAPKKAKSKPKPKPPPRPPKKNNFGGAVLRCNPPITYEDANRCGYTE